MSADSIPLSLDRRLLHHPRAYHLRRMRLGVWLYLDLLGRTSGKDAIKIEPEAIGREMGLDGGTVRSWLGHLRKAGYLSVERLNGKVRISIRNAPDAPVAERTRVFSVGKLQRLLHENGNEASFEAALRLYPDAVIRRALAGALAPPEERIRRSRTALFLYLLKRHHHA